MALFSLDIEKNLNGVFWTNRYILQMPLLAEGSPTIAAIIAGERAITNDDVVFTRYRLSSTVTGDDSYVIVPIDADGLYAAAGNTLPLFNVVRVDFGVGFGRPSRKYYRTVFTAAMINGQFLSDAYKTVCDNAMSTMLAAAEDYVDVDGQPIINQQVYSQIGMRQLRRGSKRKTTPVLG